MKKYLVPALVLLALLLRAPSAIAEGVLYEAYTPATSNYISFCDGNYHGLHHCNFTRTFSVSSDQLATAISWYDLGCNSADAANATLAYVLANADTYAVVAETTQSATVTCSPDYPVEHNNPTTLAIEPTKLVAGQRYFIILRALNNEHVRAYWGTDAAHESSFQVLDALSIGDLAQLKSDGVTPIAAREMLTENTLILGGTPANATGNPVQVQVELRRLTEGFTGQPTATGSFVASGQAASATVSGLIDGAYHWKMRVADSQGNVSNWQRFGIPGSSDFEIFVSPLPATFPIPNPSCRSSFVTFVPYAPMVLLGANFWTSCYNTPNSYIGCYGVTYSQVFDASHSTLLAQSDGNSFAYTQGAYDLNYTMTFSGANQITLQPGVAYTFRNFATDGSDCSAGPYHPDSAYLEIAPPPSPPASLLQFQSDSTTPIPEGATTTETTVVFQATSPVDSSFALQLELRRFSESFTGNLDGGVLTSSVVNAGQAATVTRPGLSNNQYKWRARLLNAQNSPMSDWQQFGVADNVDFTVQNLGQAAADLAKLVISGRYLGDGATWGGKGWDPVRAIYVTAGEIGTGYQYWNNKLRTIAFGDGLDCSGLVEWAFNRAFDPTKALLHNVIRYAGADGEYKNNSQPVAETNLGSGDLLFLDKNDDGRMDHVAMYVGNEGTFDIVEAASRELGIITSKKEQFKNRTGFRGFRRVMPNPALGGFVKAGSPIDLAVTDPEGFTISPTTADQTDEEYLREVPGELYYTENELGPDGRPEDVIYWPVQKAGTYIVKVTPEAGVPLTDTYSLEFHAGDQTAVLAEDLPLSQIPDQGYGIAASSSGTVTTFVPVSVDIKPNSLPNSINLGSGGAVPVAILGSRTFDVREVDPNSITVANAAIKFKGNGQPMAGYQDINGDGFADITVHIVTEALQLTSSDVKADLRGVLLDGREIRGSDSVRVVQ